MAHRIVVVAAVAVVALTGLASCQPAGKTSLLRSVGITASTSSAASPSAANFRRPGSSPVDVVQGLARCWARQDLGTYAGLFTDDFVFMAAAMDSAGNPYRYRPWLREDELLCARHVFVGGGVLPPARLIHADMGNQLVATMDPRPGRDPRVHRTIAAAVDLWLVIPVRRGKPVIRTVHGYASFYVVRGDSALIPADLLARGVRPDSTRWWVERWEDRTLPLTTGPVSWFALKAAYWPSAGSQ